MCRTHHIDQRRSERRGQAIEVGHPGDDTWSTGVADDGGTCHDRDDRRKVAGEEGSHRSVGGHATHLRLAVFRPSAAGSAVDAVLRDDVLPQLCRTPGIADVYAGRLGEDATDRVVASVWIGPALTLPDSRLEERLLVDVLPSTNGAADGVATETLPLDVAARFDRPEPAGILRIFRGAVKGDDLDAYIAEAQGGMLQDAEVNAGLIAFYLGRTGDNSFLTVSAWTGWDAIERATGGNIRDPFATRNSSRLATFSIRHFEIVPDLERPARPVGD